MRLGRNDALSEVACLHDLRPDRGDPVVGGWSAYSSPVLPHHIYVWGSVMKPRWKFLIIAGFALDLFFAAAIFMLYDENGMQWDSMTKIAEKVMTFAPLPTE